MREREKGSALALPNAVSGRPKTIHSNRLVPMHPLLEKALIHWFDKGWQAYTGRKPKLDDPVFPRGSMGRSDVGKPGDFCFSESAELLRKDLLRVGLPLDYTDPIKGITVELDFHALRHTFSHLLEENGADDAQVGVLLGHASRSVARSNYLAKNINVFRQLVDSIPLTELQLKGETIKLKAGKVIPFKRTIGG